MSALLKKEFRLLRPAWLVVLALEIVLPWFGDEQDHAFTMAPIFFFFGMILLAVDSFGREFSLGTFSSLMAQPIERHRIWRTKITVLFAASALIFAAYFASCGLRLHLMLAESHPQWRPIEIEAWNTGLISNFQQNIAISVAVMFVALTGGLWTTLLFRQIAAAFWITFLAPAGLLMATLFFLPSSLAAEEHVFTALLYSLAGLYVVWGFWLAHRQFHRAQDAGWTGGVVSFSRWRYFESGSKSSVSTRHRKPVVALIKKEFQLQSISWFCAAALLALHLAVILMRYIHGSFNFERDSVASVTSEFFWTIWLVMPLIISSTTVAEERRLGVTEGQFCQPVSRQLQFVLKFFPAIFSGVLLGGLMPLLLEGIAAAIGAPNPDFKSFYDSDSGVSATTVLGLSLGLSLAAFYASTLTKSFMQAMGIAVIVIIGCCLFTSVAGHLHSFLGVDWNPTLTIGFTVLTVIVMAPWLTYRNFKYVQEHGRVWRQNAFGLTGAILFIFIVSAALYNRAWEVFEPAEPAHGPAMLSLANSPTLHNNGDDLQVRLSDGRVWFASLGYSEISLIKRYWLALVYPFPVCTGPRQFMAGSNWVSVTAKRTDYAPEGKEATSLGTNHVTGYLDTIGVQKDGTLWISNPNHGQWTGRDMTRFGNETNWQQVIRSFPSVFVLKSDGTLWRWGTNHLDWSDWRQHWPSLQTSQLYPVCTNSTWKELSSSLGGLGRKADGSVWAIRTGDQRDPYFVQATNLDQASLKTLSVVNNQAAYIRKDGTLWLQWQYSRNGTNVDSGFVRVGTETNWIAVALPWNNMVALKSDGSLWQWYQDYKHSFIEAIQQPPTRLSIHNDWVAIVATGWQNTVALAADGSLWLWPNRELYYTEPLLKLPKQPQFLGNIFGQAK